MLAGLVAIEFVTNGPSVNDGPPAPRPAGSAQQTARGLQSDGADTAKFVPGWVSTILAHPLFNADRRPVAPTAVGPGPAAAGLPRLSGVLVSPAGRRAIFAGPEGARPITIAEGGHLGVYTITRIDEGSVTVTGPDGPRQIRPSFATGSEGAAARPDSPGLLRPGASPTGFDLIRNPPNIPIPAAPKR